MQGQDGNGFRSKLVDFATFLVLVILYAVLSLTGHATDSVVVWIGFGIAALFGAGKTGVETLVARGKDNRQDQGGGV